MDDIVKTLMNKNIPIKCIDNSLLCGSKLTIGKHYTIGAIFLDTINVVNDMGCEDWFSISRFDFDVASRDYVISAILS